MHSIVLLLGKSSWYSDIGSNRTDKRLVLELDDPLENEIKVPVARDVPIE
jgi:hypothetical protein